MHNCSYDLNRKSCEQLIRGNFDWHHPRNPHIYIYSHISTCEDRLCFRIAGCYWQFVVMWPPLPANEGAVCCWQSSRSCIIAQSGEERRAGRTWRSVMQWATWRCCYSCDTWHVTRDGSARVPRRPGGGPRPRHAGHSRARLRGQDRAHQQILQWHIQWGKHKHSLSLTQVNN